MINENMVRNYEKKVRHYTKAGIEKAVAEVQQGQSLNSVAIKYGVSRTLLKNRLKDQVKKQGRKTVFPMHEEEKMASAVKKMAEAGFGPTIQELQSIVKDYVEENDIATPFKDGLPGYDWTVGFMKRHNLSLKRGGLMQLARKNVTSDPFVIYGFYALLDAEIKRLGIEDRPECIWNCDETGFPMDPSKFKTIGEKGKKSIRVTCGANRENITVLAVDCADGRCLDPLIIFKGKNLQTSWHGDKALPNTYYSVSESGWMTTDVFHAWFVKFAEDTKAIRPLLLLFDGHMTHSSIQTIELAKQENISVMKLPAHCTDLLQPLDVSCFAPLKYFYEKELLQHVHETGGRQPLRKAQFVNMLCSIWRKGLNETNIKAGFKATGIFPVNKEKYKISRLDKFKLELYNKWQSSGSPKDEEGNPILKKNRPQETEWTSNVEEMPSTSSICNIQAVSAPSTSTTVQSRIRTTKDIINELQLHALEGMKYEVRLVSKDESVSIESVLKSRGRQTNDKKKKRKRVKINGSILTNEEFNEQVENFEANGTIAKKRKAGRRKRNADEDEEIERRMEREIHRQMDEDMKRVDTEDEMVEESDDESEEMNNETREDTVVGMEDVEEERRDVTEESVNEQKKEKRTIKLEINKKQVGKYFAVFWEKPKTYYWGKLLKIFRYEVDGKIEQVEFKFLHKKSTSEGAVYWDWPTKEDIDIVNVENCFWGPSTAVLTSVGRAKSYFGFAEEEEVKEKFVFLSKYGLHNA